MAKLTQSAAVYAQRLEALRAIYEELSELERGGEQARRSAKLLRALIGLFVSTLPPSYGAAWLREIGGADERG